MQFSEAWLREFCNPPINTQNLADLLTMAGLEVEELHPVAPTFTGVVIAEILATTQHPNADRLRVCTVDAGNASPTGPLQIVCGAANARPGIRVPLAMVGAVLPPGEDGKPFVINVGKLRGVESFGMLCAADELGISDDHAGLLELPSDAPIGMDIRQYLQLDDTLFTLKLTPNLAHALSVYGIARELAALTGAPLKSPVFPAVKSVHPDKLPVRIDAPDLCGRFTGRVIRKVNPQAKTPDWMVRRLERCGQRSISALVDISNYVMFEYGRPNHIFDYDKIQGSLQVRWAKPGETLELLNGKTVELDAKVGVVADDKGVESLAGIMGGAQSAVRDSTQTVYVEAAFWHPAAIRGRGRRFNFSTDAGFRFERGVDPALTVEHIEYLTQLIMDICGGEPGPIDDQIGGLPVRQPITLRVNRAAKIIGMPISQEQCSTVMTRLGLQFSEEPGKLLVTPPSWRFDLAIEEDLIEEVIRVIGYETLTDSPPIARLQACSGSEKVRSPHALRRAVAALDYQETINFGFVEERWERELAGNANPIRLLNPIAAPLAVMRSSLIGSLLQVLRYNHSRRLERVRIFEFGRVFLRDSTIQDSLQAVAGINQPIKLAGLAFGDADQIQWGVPSRKVDFYDIKGDVMALLAPRIARFVPANHPAMHPGRSAAVELDGIVIGHVGELHPRWCAAYEITGSPVIFELDAASLMARPLPAVTALPKHLGVERDISIIVPVTISADSLIAAISKSETDGLLQMVRVFDVYRPGKTQGEIADSERSLAIRLDLLDNANPLTEDRINAVLQAAIKAVKSLGGRLRS